MSYFYLLIALILLSSIAAAVLAVFSWRAAQTKTRAYYYLLAHLAVLLVACFTPLPVAIGYKAAIILGLLLTLLARLLHMLLRMPAVVIQAFDLVVFLLYIAAFAALHPLKWPTPWLLLFLLLGGLYYWALLPRLAELDSTFAGYGIVLLLLTWQAVELVVVQPALWTWLAMSGALGLAVLKALLALDHAYAIGIRPRPLPSHSSAQWAWTTWAGGQVPVHLVTIAQILQTRLVQLIERLQLPTLAQKSTAILPLLTLLCQWLLALSIWGPALVGFVA